MEDKIKELTLLLLYLTSWKEKDKYYEGIRSWKGYPFDVLEELCERDLISGSKKSKSIYLNQRGQEIIQ